MGNPRKLRFVWDSNDKSDERDAGMLGIVCRFDPKLLWPLRHRSSQTHADLAMVKSRDALVSNRTRLINHARGVVKTTGERLPGCSSASFAKRCAEHVPDQIGPLTDF